MVVGDDNVGAELVNVLRFFCAGNTAINRDEEFGIAFLEDFVNRFFGKAVAVRAFGDVHVRFDTEIAQGVVHDGGRANTVGVVIAEYRYRPALVAGLGD